MLICSTSLMLGLSKRSNTFLRKNVLENGKKHRKTGRDMFQQQQQQQLLFKYGGF